MNMSFLDRFFEKSDVKLMFLNPSLLKNPYFVSWRIRNIKSNLTSYPSAEKGKANPILGL